MVISHALHPRMGCGGSKIHKKSMKTRCSKRDGKIVKNASKGSQNGEPKSRTYQKKWRFKKTVKFCPKIDSTQTPWISLSNLLPVNNLQKKHQQREKNNIEGYTRLGTSNNQCQHARVPAAQSGTILGAKMMQTWVKSSIENMFDFWIAFGRALGRHMEATAPLNPPVLGPPGGVGEG